MSLVYGSQAREVPYLDPITDHLRLLDEKRAERIRKAAEAQRLEQERIMAQSLASPQADERGCEGEACSPGSAAVGAKPTGLLAVAKANKHGERLPISTVFYLQGSCQQLNAFDPMASAKDDSGGNWEAGSHAEESGREAILRPWRHLFDPNGQVALYGKGKRSHLVLQGTMLDAATNKFPFPVGIFTTCKVSRTTEYPGFEERIKSVQHSFYKWEKANNPERPRKLYLVEVVPPQCSINYEENIVYRSLDAHAEEGHCGPGSYDEKLEQSKKWVGRTYEEFKSGILNAEVYPRGQGQGAESGERLAYLRTEGPLISFVDGNWQKFMEGSRYGGNTANDAIILHLRAEEVYPENGLPAGMDPNVGVAIRVLPWSIVERALEWFRCSQAALPFENFEDDRIYVARMNGDSWHEDTSFVDEAYVSAKLQFFFTVVAAGESHSHHQQQ